MPIYSYECDNCHHEFDQRQGFNDANLTLCPACEKETLHRVYHPAQIVFKGAGYYVNDSRSKKSTLKNPKNESNGTSTTGTDKTSDTKKESKPAESKSTKKSVEKTSTTSSG